MKIYYREKSGGIEILRCFGIEGRVEIPGMIDDKLVISAAPYAFSSHMDEKEDLKNASLWEVSDGLEFGREEHVLAGNDVEEIVFPDTLKEIGRYIFYGCGNLKKLEFSDSLIVNVNVSYKQLKDDDFAEYVLGILKEYQFPPERLMMELTESCKAHDLPVLMRTMNKLREHRVLVALDDFGTGYASLDILQDISVDCLKIEQCFVAECEKNNVDRNIIKHIILLAHSLGLKVCMEGVETEGIYDVAVEEQADILQGYYFSRPVPAGDFQKMLRRSAGHEA